MPSKYFYFNGLRSNGIRTTKKIVVNKKTHFFLRAWIDKRCIKCKRFISRHNTSGKPLCPKCYRKKRVIYERELYRKKNNVDPCKYRFKG